MRPEETIWEASQRSGVSVNRSQKLSTPESPRPNGLSLQWRLTEEGKLPNRVRTIRGPNS